MKNRTLILGALFLLLLGGAGIWIAFKKSQEIKELRNAGVETTGEVVDGSYRKGRLSSRYYLTVEFQPEGGSRLSLNREVPEETYEAGKNGGAIKVRYMAANPEVCAFGDKEMSAFSSFLTGGGLFFLGLFCLFTSVGSGDPDQSKNETVNKGAASRMEAHTYAPVMNPAREFPRVDHDFYHRTMKQLEEFGFRYLGDEKLTNVKMDTFIRYLVSTDGQMFAACYYFKPGMLAGMLGASVCRTVEFGSALKDGTFVNTSNAGHLSAIKYPAPVDTEHLNAETPVPDLIPRHRQRVQKYVAAGGRVVVLKTLEDVHRVGNAEQKVKATWRKNPQVGEAELRAMAQEALTGLARQG
jgi:hypothetical protein